MAACFMANCQVLSFDKVLNGQKVKPTHRTHTHTHTTPPPTHTHAVAHKLRTKLPEQNTHRHEDFFGVFLCLHCQLRLRLVPGQFPKFSLIWKIFGQAVVALRGQVPGKCRRKAACRFQPIHTHTYVHVCICFCVCALGFLFMESVIV